MAGSDEYERMHSDDDDDEPSSKSGCIGPFKTPTGYPIKRKVIDVEGRLGSLYDSATDQLIDRYAARRSWTKRPSNKKRYVSRIFSADRSNELIDLLRNIEFDGAVRHSIRHNMVIPTGAGRLVEYDQPITRNTRFLYYSYRPVKEMLSVKAQKADRVVPPPSGSTAANYMITEILWGIEILFVIQPNNEPLNTVDRLLKHIGRQLKSNRFPIRLDNDEQRLINRLHNIAVFGSETCIDDLYLPILTILNRIPHWQEDVAFHQPLIYTLQPLRWLYRNVEFQESSDPHDPADRHINRIQPFLKRVENQLKALDETFHSFPGRFPSTVLNERSKDFQQYYRLLLDSQEDLQNRVRKIIPDIRRRRVNPIVLDNLIYDLRYQCLQEGALRDFQNNVQSLLDKAILIEKLTKDRIEYINAFDVASNGRNPMTNEAIDAALKRSFAKDNGNIVLWYAGDRLRREQGNKWNQIYQQLTDERRQGRQLIRLIYVDFTQCKQRLENFVIVRLPEPQRPSLEVDHPSSRTKSAPSSPVNRTRPYRLAQSSDRPPTRIPPPPPPTIPTRIHEPPPPPSSSSMRKPLPRTEINVLLLGETGVGKSTFINAFVNYLKFQTLEQAERGEPVVLIPVSFLITIGDQFDEFLVKFGNDDPNEDYEHQGQSVTQHCKSYIFDLNNQFSLRLIDTPGIGDTRGLALDIKNIDHILTYINTLPCLNAVCLLLKPNTSRLNVFFRSCINQLLSYLTPIGYNNIIFCFTNARSTFYAPGDTGRLLREMLNQEHLTDIPFQKENSFCFDSESFRYLAARKRQVEFDDYQKVECKNSWNASVTESVRLLKFIRTREPYALQEYQSPRKAAVDIIMLARPLMETLRLIIYNWKISEAKLVFNQMIIRSDPVAMEICTHCAQTNLVEVGPFWLTQYQPAPIRTAANQHLHCPSDRRSFLIETVVRHAFPAQGAGLQHERWQSSFRNFLFKCDQIYHFLRQQGPSATEDDPFERIIDRFLDEEQQIAEIRSIDSTMNQRVREVLRSIKQIRQNNSQKLFQSKERLSLKTVYDIIHDLTRMPTVREQWNCIKQSRELIMKSHESRIPADLIHNRTFD